MKKVGQCVPSFYHYSIQPLSPPHSRTREIFFFVKYECPFHLRLGMPFFFLKPSYQFSVAPEVCVLCVTSVHLCKYDRVSVQIDITYRMELRKFVTKLKCVRKTQNEVQFRVKKTTVLPFWLT